MILVTGASGFVGSYLVKKLCKEGHSIKALKRSNSKIDHLSEYSDKIEWLNGDLLDIDSLEAAFKDVTQVYHTAAIVSFRKKHRSKMMEVNVQGTANLVNICLENNIKKLVHLSSVAAIGRLNDGKVITEETEWAESSFNTSYAKSKQLAELEVWRGIAEGLNATILNPSIILGAFNWNNGSARWFPLLNSSFKYFPAGSSAFVDVRDVVEIMVLAMNHNLKNERYIVCSENMPYREVFSKIAHAIDQKAPSKKVSKTMAEFTWRLAGFIRLFIPIFKPSITKETARLSQHSFTYSNEKICRTLNYKFLAIDESVNDTGRVFLEHKRADCPML